MTSPYEISRSVFSRHFGGGGVSVRAPGRVNLIGEHTDYNEGFVLPCAIDFHTVVTGRARADMTVRVVAADYGNARDEFRLDQPVTPRADALWANYVRGVARHLLLSGVPIRGADLVVSGNVPQGAGLSSSAALEVAVGQAFKTLHDLAVSPSELALIAQTAENQFVGCRCGVMDPLISACGRKDHALLIDCRSLQARAVRLPDGMAVMILNSHVQRDLVDSEYNARRAQCEAAARHYRVAALRDIDLPALEDGAAGLDAVTLRRARHVVSENQRTLDAADALSAGDMVRLGRLMAQSHVSMRDDFQVTVPAIDRLVDIVGAVIGEGAGVRMTGGGFGGCVVAMVPEPRVAAVRAAVELGYRSPDGRAATVYVCRAEEGAGAL